MCSACSAAPHVLSLVYVESRSENGEIVVKEQVQSEYWHIKYYSLLISISRFLVTADWNSQESPLPAKAEVTVQPAHVPPNTIIYTKGSYFATVKEGSKVPGENVEYILLLQDGSTCTVPRHRLRHRVWHSIAFLGVTNEKQHVSTTTQAFHARQLEFWHQWHKAGRDAAMAFACTDRAGTLSQCHYHSEDSGDYTDFAQHLARIEEERFTAYVGHRDNATHFKSSGSLHWWSEKQEELIARDFIRAIRLEFGCPGKGKGPWDGIGAVIKTKVRNDITNNIPSRRRTTQSGRITTALEVLGEVPSCTYHVIPRTPLPTSMKPKLHSNV